jgi:hypothetical protein
MMRTRAGNNRGRGGESTVRQRVLAIQIEYATDGATDPGSQSLRLNVASPDLVLTADRPNISVRYRCSP